MADSSNAPRRFAAWFRVRFPVLAYHLGLLRGIRGPSTDAAHWVADWLAVILLFGAGLALLFSEPLARIFTQAAAGVDPRWAFLPWGLLVLYALMKANYAEIERRDGKIKELTLRVVDYQQEYMFDKFYYRLIEELTEGMTMHGHDRLVRMLDQGHGTQAELYALFDTWESSVTSSIEIIDKDEVGFFTRAVEPSMLQGDWRERLRTLLEIRKSRIETIQVRQKVRYDGKVEERKKKAKAARS